MTNVNGRENSKIPVRMARPGGQDPNKLQRAKQINKTQNKSRHPYAGVYFLILFFACLFGS